LFQGKSRLNVSGEILQLKETINTMVDQLERLRRRSDARSPAEGSAPRASSAARPRCPAWPATWKDLTDNVNSMATNLTGQVPATSPRSPPAVARRRPSPRKITVDVQGGEDFCS